MTTASHFSLLVVDDEPDLRTLYELTLLREGYDMDTAASVQEALLHLKDRTYSAVITEYGSAENAVDALKAGAYDYLTKPVDLKQFRAVVASALGRGGAPIPTIVPSSLPSEQRPAPAVARPPPRPTPPPSPVAITS